MTECPCCDVIRPARMCLCDVFVAGEHAQIRGNNNNPKLILIRILSMG
ncbi:hypothetical protein [Chlamydia psittaci]|nr:hypothetical protein [Chlamydia psittaci]AFS24335.1 hypothetical protein B602_0182 [Chlamydia psittaci M56]AGE74740.1 hypothetical protein AO9_00855 [Chlamydia psittaci Mat116]EPP32082.1 hypothetical protein CP8484711_0326 [Chlamydia psittaci 84-8471/1]